MSLSPLVTRAHLGLADRMWSDALGNLFDSTSASSVSGGSWAPAVDIVEEESRYLVHVDLPGVDPKNVEITMEDGSLSVKGERVSSREDNSEGTHRVERSYGSFYRRFSFPKNVDVDKIKASGENGVLEIELPKLESAKTRKIEVS